MRFPERLRLAHLPTPIHRLERLSAEVGVGIWLWRDDSTGFVDSGNKIRKLEFLVSAAVAAKATRLITCGGPQSNHARATVYAARRLGLDVTVVVREPRTGLDRTATPSGNLLLDHVAGADIRVVPFTDYVARGSTYDAFLEEERQRSLGRGERPYVVPEGGSCKEGSFGYIAGVEEMLATWASVGPGTKAPDSFFLALGSGGTHAGVHLGYERQGLPSETVYAVNVCDDEAYFQKRVGRLIDETISAYDLPCKSRQLTIFDGHQGAGYAIASDDDLRFYAKLARQEGVLLDPVYTGKAFQGMLRELRKAPRRFGRDVLFLHSGGAFATFAFAAQYRAALGDVLPQI